MNNSRADSMWTRRSRPCARHCFRAKRAVYACLERLDFLGSVLNIRGGSAHGCARLLRRSPVRLFLMAMTASRMANKLPRDVKGAEQTPEAGECIKIVQYEANSFPGATVSILLSIKLFGKSRAPIDLSIFISSLCMLIRPSEAPSVSCIHAHLPTCCWTSYTSEG